jgi:hypothetical protein
VFEQRHSSDHPSGIEVGSAVAVLAEALIRKLRHPLASWDPVLPELEPFRETAPDDSLPRSDSQGARSRSPHDVEVPRPWSVR